MAETTPARPAVSGPGALSRRTDTGPAQKLQTLGDAQYGEAATFRDLQKSAPLAQAPQPGRATVTSGSPTGSTPSTIPLNAPTVRPNEPITAGAPVGPGPGPEALGLSEGEPDYTTAKTTLQSIADAGGSTEVQALLQSMNSRF